MKNNELALPMSQLNNYNATFQFTFTTAPRKTGRLMAVSARRAVLPERAVATIYLPFCNRICDGFFALARFHFHSYQNITSETQKSRRPQVHIT